MASEANAPVPAATVDNGAGVVANGSVDGDVLPNGDVMPNGDGVSLTAPPAHDQGANADTISQDEVALYDRQIRLWGLQAQENIRKANILLISAKALANEIAKNLVLAGIGALTIIDPEVVTDMDLGAQFFITEADVGRNRAEAAAPRIQELNHRVKVFADPSDIRTKPPEFLSPYDIVIATDLDFPTIKTLNAASRINNRRFYAAGAHGLYGYIFADLIQHDYVVERGQSNRPTKAMPESATRSIIAVTTKTSEDGKIREVVTKQELYNPIQLANTSPLAPELLASPRKLRKVTPLLSCLRALWEFEESTGRYPNHTNEDIRAFTQLATEKHKELQLPQSTLSSNILRSFLHNIGSELAPVTAFLGGQLAQDVINVLGAREQPTQNFLLFDGETLAAPMYALHPIFVSDLQAVNGTNGATSFTPELEPVAGPSDAVILD